MEERLKLKAEWTIRKFCGDFKSEKEALKCSKPFKTVVIKDNLALNEGIQELLDIICGLGTPTKWDNTNARLGVGDSSTAESPTQTGLQGTNKTFKAMDSGYPSRSGQVATWKSTFGSAEGNHGWKEFTVVNGVDDTGKNLNRKVSDQGTKASGQTWTLTLNITPS